MSSIAPLTRQLYFTLHLSSLLIAGVIPWGKQVQEILDYHGKEAVRVAKESQYMPLVSMLLHGPSGSGKTALAAYMARHSGITFVKVLSPEDMVGFSDSAKCGAIKKVFEDAYKSEISCIVIDDIERMMGECHVVSCDRFTCSVDVYVIYKRWLI